MNHKKKLGYIGLGAVIMLIGMGVGSILTPQLVAQHNGVFDEITCRKITVVDKAGNEGIRLRSSEMGNTVRLFDKAGKMAIDLHTTSVENRVTIADPSGKTAFWFNAGVDRNELGRVDICGIIAICQP